MELCRATGLAPSNIVDSLINPETAGKPAELNGQKPKEWLKGVKTPQPSRTAQRIESEIFSEGQRYQRRFQFQNDDAKGNPASRLVRKEVINEQMKRVKVVYTKPADPETLRQQKREETIKRVAFRWQNKTYRPPKEQPDLENIAAANELVGRINSVCTEPIARPNTLQEVLLSAKKTNKPFLLISWDCFTIKSPNQGKTFFIDLEAPFKTLSPGKEELAVIDLLRESPFPFNFKRFLPDDEIPYVTPEIARSIGEEEIRLATGVKASRLDIEAKTIYPYAPDIYPFTYLFERQGVKNIYDNMFSSVFNSFNGTSSPYVDERTVEKDVEFRRGLRYGTPIDWKKALLLSQRVFALYAAEMAVLFSLYGNSMVLLQNERISGPKYDLYAKINPKFNKLPMIFV